MINEKPNSLALFAEVDIIATIGKTVSALKTGRTLENDQWSYGLKPEGSNSRG